MLKPLKFIIKYSKILHSFHLGGLLKKNIILSELPDLYRFSIVQFF